MGIDEFKTDDNGLEQDADEITNELQAFIRDRGYITSSVIRKSDDFPSIPTLKKRLNVDTWEGVLEKCNYWEINKWKPDKGWNPGAQNQRLLHVAFNMLRDEERTVRDVYYGLESRGFDYDYNTVNRALKEGRRHRCINPDWIIDSSRLPIRGFTSGYPSPKRFIQREINSIHDEYFENWWTEMDEYVEVWVEKASLESVFRSICNTYNVRLLFMGGNWSDSKVYRAVERLIEQLLYGKDVTILYFGDFNGSGLHAPIAIQNNMEYYGIDMLRDGVGASHPDYFEIAPNGRVKPIIEISEREIKHKNRIRAMQGKTVIDPSDMEIGTIQFDRVALTLEQIRDTYPDLPSNPLPTESKKSKMEQENMIENVTYELDNPDVDIELNALKEFHRDDLEQMIEDAITDHIDEGKKEEVEQRIEERKHLIDEAVSVDMDKFSE